MPWRRIVCLFLTSLLPVTAQTGPEIDGCSVFPPGNIWNVPVDELPVDENSAAYVSTIGADRNLHPDFGSGLWNGGPIGIPFVVVPGGQPRLRASFLYDDESDPGPYAVPLDAPIEGESQSDGDRHAIALDRDNCILYELYRAFPREEGAWRADSGAIFDLRSHNLRPEGWTSADAAGLPILPGLIRYEEVEAGEIRHAIRFTAPETRRAFVWPARHFASRLTEARYPPMGQRFRLRASFDASGFSTEAQVVLRALKKYGMILADNGSAWFLSGAPDERWNNERLRDLRRVQGSDFEAVDVSSWMIDRNSGATATQAASPAVVNSADFRYGPVSPGEIVSIFASGIGPVESAALTFDGLAAPLLYVSSTQVNAIVPYGVARRANVRMEILSNASTVTSVTLPVAAATPAIFTPVFDENYQPVTSDSPVRSGAVVVVFLTGLGQTDPDGVDGKVAREVLPKPRLPVSVHIGGREAELLYVGAAPGLIAGVFQINFRVPSGLPAGDHPLLVAAGRYLSSPGLQVPVL